jgi:hypothetical protein
VDRIAKEAALSKEVQKEDATLAKVCFTLPVLPDQPEYSPQEREQACEAGAKENSEGWFITREGGILLPEKTALGPVREHMTSPIWAKPPYKNYYTNTWSFLPIGDFNSVSQPGLSMLPPT